VNNSQHSGVVLLAEDEPLVRLFVAELLSDTQLHVIEAANAEEALTVLRANLAVDVLVTDVEMPPGANGYELARQVHDAWPLVEIIVTSGREWPQAGSLPPGATFLPKPYPNSTLVSHVGAAVGRARAARATQSEQPTGGRKGRGYL
jgi:two-component system, response regulator PdtaR